MSLLFISSLIPFMGKITGSFPTAVSSGNHAKPAVMRGGFQYRHAFYMSLLPVGNKCRRQAWSPNWQNTQNVKLKKQFLKNCNKTKMDQNFALVL